MQKIKWQNILSVVSIVLSSVACIVTWLRVDVHIENDTFVGLMSGLMGVCATILVGAQIYNSIETKDKIKNIETLQSNLARQINETKEFQAKEIKIMGYHISRAQGLSLHAIQPFTAYMAFFDSLERALKMNDSAYIETSLNDLNGIAFILRDNDKVNGKDSDKIQDLSADNLNKYESFALIKNRYIDIYSYTMKYISEHK